MVQNDPEWTRVYSTTEPYKLEIVKAVLADNNIESVEVNKKDSAYIFIGDIELYVHQKDAVLASFIIQSNQL
jgi:hypothetical protein